MKRILVTGGAGFVGSHLCERLLKEGNEVVCMDNYFTGRKSKIVHLMDNPYFELIRHDVTLPYFIEVDEIYNLACPASPVHYQYNPIKTIKTSVLGAINMLGLAKRIKAKILQASTSEVYGDPEVHPQPEDYWGHVNPIGIRSCYDEGKRCAESLFINYHNSNEVLVKIIRIFNTYGPRMEPDDGRVVSNFIMQALQGQDITIFGDGTQTRSFQYVTGGRSRSCSRRTSARTSNPPERPTRGSRESASRTAPACPRRSLRDDDPRVHVRDEARTASRRGSPSWKRARCRRSPSRSPSRTRC